MYHLELVMLYSEDIYGWGLKESPLKAGLMLFGHSPSDDCCQVCGPHASEYEVMSCLNDLLTSIQTAHGFSYLNTNTLIVGSFKVICGTIKAALFMLFKYI